MLANDIRECRSKGINNFQFLFTATDCIVQHRRSCRTQFENKTSAEITRMQSIMQKEAEKIAGHKDESGFGCETESEEIESRQKTENS